MHIDQRSYFTYSDSWQALRHERRNLREYYAHPIDEAAITRLQKRVDKELRTAISEEINRQYGAYIQSSVPVSANHMPRIYQILLHCAQTLRIPLPYAVVGKNMGTTINAFTVGTDEFAYLVISPRVAVNLTSSELRFIIGHECGHIALEHVLYHTMFEMNYYLPGWGTTLLDAATSGISFQGLTRNAMLSDAGNAASRVILAGWQKQSEISADRAGLLCCQDLSAAERALVTSVVGETNISSTDVDLYLEALSKGENNQFVARLNSSHPSITRRIHALRLFAHSEDYHALVPHQATSPAIYGRKALRENINQLILGS